MVKAKWMSAVFGLCGIHCAGDTIHIDPHLPAQWEMVSLPLIFHGQKLKICLTQSSISVTPINPLETPLHVKTGESVYPLQSEITIQPV
jgi:trehalose/maltose hydrolase-like predicted phosphorylase